MEPVAPRIATRFTEPHPSLCSRCAGAFASTLPTVAERADPHAAAAEPARDVAAAAGGAPVSMEQFTALGGPTSEDVVLRMQERVGNQATTEWLSQAVAADEDATPRPAQRAATTRPRSPAGAERAQDDHSSGV